MYGYIDTIDDWRESKIIGAEEPPPGTGRNGHGLRQSVAKWRPTRLHTCHTVTSTRVDGEFDLEY
jgi:hypothetical protein